MAEKKEHKIVSASTGKVVTGTSKPSATVQKQNVTGLRIGAVILWVAALALEVLALFTATESMRNFLPIEPLYTAIIFLAADFICVVVGAQLWKNANHKNPASQKNALKFWLWNNMGVIAAAVAFIPFVILLLVNKDADKKTKTIGTAVAAAFLVISGLASYDWNPVSAEAVAMAQAEQQVYWTAHGKKFHLYEDCQALNRSEELVMGTAQEAMDAGKGTICKFCEKRFSAENPDVIEAIQESVEDAAVNE